MKKTLEVFVFSFDSKEAQIISLGTCGVETAHHHTPLPSQQLLTGIHSNTTGELQN
jgi:hypothetical protein